MPTAEHTVSPQKGPGNHWEGLGRSLSPFRLVVFFFFSKKEEFNLAHNSEEHAFCVSIFFCFIFFCSALFLKQDLLKLTMTWVDLNSPL